MRVFISTRHTFVHEPTYRVGFCDTVTNPIPPGVVVIFFKFSEIVRLNTWAEEGSFKIAFIRGRMCYVREGYSMLDYEEIA